MSYKSVKWGIAISFAPQFFLMIDDYNMDERLESSWHLVYYQVSGEPGIAGCSRRSDIYLGECGLACRLFFINCGPVSLLERRLSVTNLSSENNFEGGAIFTDL